MSHKVTFDMLAAQVARTMQNLPDANWNEPKRSVLEDPEVAEAFTTTTQEAPAERRGRATWGPTELTTGAPLVYAPRFKTDHHPWVTNAGRHDHPSAQIRYANHEVEEVRP